MMGNGRTQWRLIALVCAAALWVFGVTGCGSDEGGGETDTGMTSSGEDTSSGGGDTSSGGEDTREVESCGAVTFEGECNGTVLRYCADAGTEDEQLVESDCAAVYPAEENPVCAYIAPEYGYDCAISVGGACAYEGSEGGTDYVFCDGTEPGCLVAGEAVCQENLGSCELTEEVLYQCLGNNLVFECRQGQPTAMDCTAAGGTCDATLGICGDLGEGAECGNNVEESFFICGDGFRCEGATAESRGTCVPDMTGPECTPADASGCADVSCECTDGAMMGKRCTAENTCVTDDSACFDAETPANSICGEQCGEDAGCPTVMCECSTGPAMHQLCAAGVCGTSADCFDADMPQNSVCQEACSADDADTCADVTCDCTSGSVTVKHCNGDSTCATAANCFNDATPADSVCGEATPAP